MDPKEVLRFALAGTHARVLRCVEDVSEEEAQRAIHGLSPLVWQVGHLAYAEAGLLRRAGRAAPVPEEYASLFGPGTGGESRYPPLAEVRAAFGVAHGGLLQLLDSAALEDAVEAPYCHNVGELLAFAAYHRGYHVGKMTTLRALMGKPRLFG